MARLGIAKISIKAHDGHEYCDKHLRQCVDCEPPLHQRGTCNEDCTNERYTLVFLLPAIMLMQRKNSYAAKKSTTRRADQ